MCGTVELRSSLSQAAVRACVGLPGLGWNTDRGISFSAMAQAHMRPGGLAGPALWSGRWSLIQFRVFGPVAEWFWVPLPGFLSQTALPLLRGRYQVAGLLYLPSLGVHTVLAKGTLPVLLLELDNKGPAAISLTPFSCAVVFHSPPKTSAVHGAAPLPLPLAMVLN